MKLFSKYAGILAVICALLSVTLVFASCQKDEKPSDSTDTSATAAAPSTTEPEITLPATDEETTAASVVYTVTVKGEDGKGIAGVSVQLCSSKGCKMPKKTDANGVYALTTNAEEDFHATVVGAPEGYVFDEKTEFQFDADHNCVITLKKAKA